MVFPAVFYLTVALNEKSFSVNMLYVGKKTAGCCEELAHVISQTTVMLQNQITSQITRAADASFSRKVSNVCSKLSLLQLVASPYLLGNDDSRHTKVVQQSLISLVWQFALSLNSINQLCFLTLNQRRHLPRERSRRTLCYFQSGL